MAQAYIQGQYGPSAAIAMNPGETEQDAIERYLAQMAMLDAQEAAASPAPAPVPQVTTTPSTATGPNYRVALPWYEGFGEGWGPNQGGIWTGTPQGTDPRWFADNNALNTYAQGAGETLHWAPTKESVYDIVRRATGWEDYMGGENTRGIREGYTPPEINQILGGTTAGTPPPSSGGTGIPPTSAPTPGGSTIPPVGEFDPADFNKLFGLSDIPEIGAIDLPETPNVSATFSPEINTRIWDVMNQTRSDIGSAYQGDFPTMEAAQMDRGDIPQPSAMTPERFDQLDFLLSGQGFSPDVMARLRADTTEDISRMGAAQRGAGRIAAERAGLADSGAGLALENQANRNTANATSRAMNALEIENANRGLENLRMGAGMEMGRLTDTAAMKNQMAIENAARLFSGMQQNLANVQQRNLVNTQNQQDREMQRAGKQADFSANSGQQFNAAQLGRATEADTFNVGNRINRGLNQAQLNRQRDMFNVGTKENRYGQAFQGAMGLIGGANPAPYYNMANYNYQPNLVGANTMSNMGNLFLQGALSNWPKQQTTTK